MGNLTQLDDKRVVAFIDWSKRAAPHWLKINGFGKEVSLSDTHYAAWQLLNRTSRNQTGGVASRSGEAHGGGGGDGHADDAVLGEPDRRAVVL